MTIKQFTVGFTGQHAQKNQPRARSYPVGPNPVIKFSVEYDAKPWSVDFVLHEEIEEAYVIGIPEIGSGPLFPSCPVHLVGAGPHTVAISGSVAVYDEYLCVIYVPELTAERAELLNKPQRDDNLAEGNSPPRIIITP